MAVAPLVHAADFSWNASTDLQNWNNPTFWREDGVPNTGNIPGSNDDIVTSTLFPSGVSLNIASITVNDWTWNTSSTQSFIANNGPSHVDLAIDGTLTKSGTGTLAFRGPNSGSITLSLSVGHIALGGGRLSFGTATGGVVTGFTAGSATVTGGTLNFDGGITRTITGALDLSGTGIVNIAGDGRSAPPSQTATLAVGSLTGGNDGTRIRVNGNGVSGHTGTLILNNASGTSTYAGRLENGGSAANNLLSVVKNGAGGTQVLSGNNNTYGGGTSITGGKLVITNTGATSSATGTGAVSVSGATSTLAGTGSVRGANALVSVVNGGRLAPGVNTSGANTNFGVASTINLGVGSGGLTLTSANLDFDLAGLAGGSGDRIVTSGLLTLGTVTLNVNQLNGTLELNQPYTLITGASAFAGFVPENFAATGIDDYTAVFAMSENDLTVTFGPVTPVPEPASVALLGLGGLIMLARRRATTSV